jgi:uncharacterized coiled-coil DUF342 family protein
LEHDKEELFKKLDETKKTIQQLRDSLNLVDPQKEEWFRKKDEFGKQIRSLISKARQDKEQRNSFTTAVRKAKEERQKVVKLLREKSEYLKQLQDEKKKVIDKLNLKRDPAFIKREIERMEYQLETNVMSFEKEQKFMKAIKDLQKQYHEAESVSKVWEQLRLVVREIRQLKRDAEENHRKVQEAAKESQVYHERILESAKQIDELQVQEEEAHKKFLELKEQFNDVNTKLKEQLVLLNEINQKLNIYREENKKIKQQRVETILRSKEESVHEKIKRGEKLTTEDLLVLQRTEQDF